jgi:P-type Ca2+ transporter type 2B
LRTISVAYKETSVNNAVNLTEEELCRDLTLSAIFGIRDPLRPEIPSAISKCKSAGILVRMVTGDNSETAVSIAKKSGILDRDFDLVKSQAANEYWVLEGSKFSKLIGGVIDVPSDEDPNVLTNICFFDFIRKS